MIGVRIRQARAVAGLTQAHVVERLANLGVRLSKGGLSKYERSGSVPPAALLLKLAHVLGVRSEYLLTEPAVSVEWLAFRKLSRMGTRRQERIQALAGKTVEAQVWLQKKLYPGLKSSFPAAELVRTPGEAEAVAAKVRKGWGLGDLPVESLTEALEDNGGIVVECEQHEGEFDGLCGWANKRHPIITVAKTAPDDRRRFSMAHELGHLMMKCQPAQQETLAHRFAAAFIVPPAVAVRELGGKRRQISFAELAILKQKHGLSMQAWVRRALDLGIIEQGCYRSLCKAFSQRGWRTAEPVPFSGRERPTRLQQMTHRALAEGIITTDRAEQLCPGIAHDMESGVEHKMPDRLSGAQLMRLPSEQREQLLAQAAALVEREYRTNPGLTEFETIMDEDWGDAPE